MADEKIMTVKDVAGYLGVHVMTVYRCAREGTIPAFKVRGQWRFKKDILDKWMEDETNKTKLSNEM